MTVALIIFGLVGFMVCFGFYVVELALHLERNPDPSTQLSAEDFLDLAQGPHAGVVIDLAEHQIRAAAADAAVNDVDDSSEASEDSGEVWDGFDDAA